MDYLTKDETINGSYYATLLDKLRQNSRKATQISKEKILFRQDNSLPPGKNQISPIFIEIEIFVPLESV